MAVRWDKDDKVIELFQTSEIGVTQTPTTGTPMEGL
jgi:hypothetical protein